MLFRPVARPLIVVLLALGCGRRPVATQPPERAEPAPEATATPAAEDLATSPGPAAPQSVSFADDADPEPTTMVQAAPKRPPIPRFRLFGTRENDGPN